MSKTSNSTWVVVYGSVQIGEPEPVPGGRARKLVRLTPKGIDAVRRSQARLARMSEGLAEILEPGS